MTGFFDLVGHVVVCGGFGYMAGDGIGRAILPYSPPFHVMKGLSTPAQVDAAHAFLLGRIKDVEVLHPPVHRMFGGKGLYISHSIDPATGARTLTGEVWQSGLGRLFSGGALHRAAIDAVRTIR